MAVSIRVSGSAALNLGKGKGFQFHDVRSACQRFGYVLHQGELLRTSKEKSPVACAVGIYGHLEVPEQSGRILDLINNDWRRMTLKESGRFLFSLLGLDGEVKGDKGMFREQAQESGGFSGLSGAGQHDHRPGLRGALQPGFDSAWNPHAQNIRYNRILCTSFVCRSQNGKMVFQSSFMLTIVQPRLGASSRPPS